MTPATTFRERMDRVIYFFPFLLFVVQLKKNILLLLAWILLFGFITKSISNKYGVPYLFLDPEYLGKVDFWSFFVTGFCLGTFIMSFNIASYVSNGSRFPFLATLNRPFMKYSINNFIIPGIFIGAYCYCIFSFQTNSGDKTQTQIWLDLLGLISGSMLFIVFSYIYFFSTNKNLFQLFGIAPSTDEKETKAKLDKQNFKRNRLFRLIAPPLKWAREWKVVTYMNSIYKIRLARESRHYQKKVIISVFNQNQNNAARFQLLFFCCLLVLGFFKDYRYFEIPAAGSIILMITLVFLIITVLNIWLRGWFVPVLILLAFLLNYFSKHEFRDVTNKAYGLNYTGVLKEYSEKSLSIQANDIGNYLNDKQATIETLNKWHKKNDTGTNDKPKMIFINTSGGGLKSTLWTYLVLAHLDSISNNQLLDQTFLITGSSGGLIGAAYIRELLQLRKAGNEISFNNKEYINNISDDLLNPIAFSLTLNDLFLQLRTFKDKDYVYTNDRGYAFEKKLNINTKGLLDKRLSDYISLEKEAIIPMLILSPTVINDGRRLLISSQPISYLAYNAPTEKIYSHPLIEEIEFTRFFKDQDAFNLKFLSALRMNSTFPYIMPLVSMPTLPTIEVMDAGARDNFGMKTTIKFIYNFSDWLKDNTSGLVIIQTRERSKSVEIKDTRHRSLAETLTAPVGSLYENLFTIQNYNNDELLNYANKWFEKNINIISFEIESGDDPISLSWHLTKGEKTSVMKALYANKNKLSMKTLMNQMGWKYHEVVNTQAADRVAP